ncbi:MAG: type II secretion system F family protein [Candidatus Diapherotrites archaeon]|nr:type II secretion system F family protein [Candidatus Diapherotrites archaeon]
MIIEKVISLESMEPLQKTLNQLQSPYDAIQVLDFGAITSILLTTLALLLQPSLDLTPVQLTVTMLSAGFAPLALAYFIPLFLSSLRKQKLEEDVTDFLLHAATLPPRTSMTQSIKYYVENENGPLSQELTHALRQIKAGMPVSNALLNVVKRNDSKVLSRAIELVIQGHESGADLRKSLKDVAEDVFETHVLIKSRAAALTVEKYTLLLSGGIIVPALLAVVAGLVASMNFDQTIWTTTNPDLFTSVLNASQVYVAVNALLVGIFVSSQDGNVKKAVVYSPVLVILALGVYYFLFTTNVATAL